MLVKKRLTRGEKAVEIAKDVLRQLKADDLAATLAYGYCRGKEPMERSEESAQNHIDTIQKNCRVCALGACFLSYIRKYNNVSMDYILTWNNTIDIGRTGIEAKLKTVFSLKQMDLIELAFEADSWDEDNSEDFSKEQARAINLAKRLGRNANKRLTAIMKNIIKNNGVFKP